jgi:tetratricopeptide (TPR) repeat protein
MGKSSELQPYVEWHYVDRARISLKYMNDRDSALEDLKKCEAINPDNFLALVYLAGIYFDKLDFETSLGYYERLIQIRPDYYFAYEHLGILYYTQGEFAKAKEAYLKAYDKYNAKEGYILMAALAMKQLGEAQQADALLREVARTLDSESLAHEVFRFFIEGGSDYYVLDKLHKENDDFERRKFNYYLGEYYLYTESAASALNCFTEASELDLQYEGRIAQWHIQ